MTSTKAFSQVAFVYYWSIPSRNADVVYTLKNCEAIQQLGYPITLFAPGTPVDPEVIWQQFSIRYPFNLRLIPTVPLFRKWDVALRTAWELRNMPDTLVWGRHTPGLLAAARMGKPIVMEAHTPPGERMGKHYAHWIISQPSFKTLVAITQPVKQSYLEQFGKWLSPEQVIVEPNAITLEQFDQLPEQTVLRESLGLPLSMPIVGYTGHLYEGRGIDMILEMSRQVPSAIFMIVGGEEADIARWKAMIAQYSLKNVLMMGYVSNAQLPRYIKAADILLMPYQQVVYVDAKRKVSTANYMSPMKMFEYMASQRAIISSDLPVLREVLNETNARLCPPDDVEAWIVAIRELISAPQVAAQLSQRAYQDVQEHTWQKRVQRILDTVQ